MNFPCPKCEESGVSLKDKYRLAYWRDAHCGRCGARVCANPWFLAPFSLVYMWALAACAFLYMFEEAGAMALAYAVIAWVVIDLLNIMLIPMAVMRSRGDPPRCEPGNDDPPDSDAEKSEQQV